MGHQALIYSSKLDLCCHNTSSILELHNGPLQPCNIQGRCSILQHSSMPQPDTEGMHFCSKQQFVAVQGEQPAQYTTGQSLSILELSEPPPVQPDL